MTKSGKSFVTGGSENVISGVGALIGAGINMLMGSGEGVQAEPDFVTQKMFIL